MFKQSVTDENLMSECAYRSVLCRRNCSYGSGLTSLRVGSVS